MQSPLMVSMPKEFQFHISILLLFNVHCLGGQSQWVPNDDGGVVFVGWENKPRKLGLVYYPTRRYISVVPLPTLSLICIQVSSVLLESW